MMKPKRGQRTATHHGSKIATHPAKAQPKPASAKMGALKMGEMMHAKVHKTKAMKEKSNTKVKKF